MFLLGSSYCFRFISMIGGVFRVFLYLGNARFEKVREGAFNSLLRRFIRTLCAFASFFLTGHAIELLTEAWTGLYLQICGV